MKHLTSKDNIFHLDFLETTPEKRCKIVESYEKTFENKKSAQNHTSAINHFLQQEGLRRTTNGISGKPSEEKIKTYRNQVESFNQWLLLNKGILIKTIRIKGFRGLENIEVDLEKTIVLTGANNTGKSSILYALQLAFGNHQFISQDDFFIKENSASQQIIIDVLIVPIDDKRCICNNFTDDWTSLFTADRIKLDPDDPNKSQVPFRTKIKFDLTTNSFKKEQFSINGWPKFKENSTNWFDKDDGDKIPFYFDEIPFFYIDAQRDILKDIKLKNSYLGKMISKIEYTEKDIKDIEEQIKSLNIKAVDSSAILSHIKTVLGEINSTMSTDNTSIEIVPFTKKVRDLNKGLSIYYADQKDSFSMEYHGMGTRSWSSLLTLKTFISSLTKNAQEKSNVFFPILAIEEPEAHLHPNAQKQLYRQINDIEGQKIISTHSPYVTTTAAIKQLRNLYKNQIGVLCGQLDTNQLLPEDQRKIERKVMNTRGEILFSKLLILCEGETEEQALPIFAKKCFKNNKQEQSLSKKETKKQASPIVEDKQPLSEIGLNTIGVGGHNYKPFLRFALSFNIPWVIFSDADEKDKKSIKEKVKEQLKELKLKEKENKQVVFLDDGKNFESQLIKDEFEDEIKEAIIDIKKYGNPEDEQKIRDLNSDQLKKKLGDKNFISKASLGPAIAKQIINSKKNLPPKIEELFKKIKIIMEEQG